MLKVNKLSLLILGLLSVYFLGYFVARLTVFHTVEYYAGVEGKGPPRQDYIAKRGEAAGEGWEYQLFMPAIKVEEGIVNFFHNLRY